LQQILEQAGGGGGSTLSPALYIVKAIHNLNCANNAVGYRDIACEILIKPAIAYLDIGYRL